MRGISRPVKRKLLWAVLPLAAIAAAVLIAAKATPYPFLGEFDGQGRTSDWTWPAVGVIRCYSFTVSPNRVLPAVERDLGGRGWKIVYRDDQIVKFEHDGPDGARYAYFSDNLGKSWNSKGGIEGAKCAIWIDHDPSWLEAQIAGLLERFTHRTKTPLAGSPYAHEVRCEVSVVPRAGRIEADLRWKSESKSQMTVELQQFEWNEYRPPESMPMEIDLGPRQSLTTHLTLPAEAGLKQEQKALEFSYDDASSYGNGQEDSGKRIRPACSWRTTPTGLALDIANSGTEGRTARPLILGAIVAWHDREPILYVDKERTLHPGRSILVPLMSPAHSGDDLRFRVSFRFVGARDWRTVDFPSDYSDYPYVNQ